MSNVPPHHLAITGLGAFSAAGPDVAAIWTAALTGQSTAKWMDDFGNGQEVACCRAGTPTSHQVSRSAFARLDRFGQLGVAAAEQAWDDASLDTKPIDPTRMGVIVGSSRGPTDRRASTTPTSIDRASQATPGARRIRPTTALYSTVSSLVGTLSGMTGARGPSLTISAACASSAVAIGIAAQQIESGVCDLVLVGGADAPLQADLMAEMRAAGIFGHHQSPALTCRPFDRDRNGIVIGEGAAFVVLESVASAERRHVPIRARLRGWSAVCDAGHRSGMSDDARGIRDAFTQTMQSAAVTLDQIDAIHLHGTGTPMNDFNEAMIARELFSQRADTLPCTSTKPITGHCLGASGALQTVLNVIALEEQRLPPTVNCITPDPACDINIVRREPFADRFHTILTHSAGFWGNHASLLLERA